MEVYAAFSTYTDEQVGRIYEYLKETDQLENTLIIYAADNGASGEGSPNGSVNENKFFNGYPDTTEENLKTVKEIGGLDRLGGPDTYEHYPTGWAVAISTPFKMFKRYSEYAGGTCDPLVMSWPKGITVKTGVRSAISITIATDIVPTILEACGLEMPAVYKGVPQYPLSGVSMCYTWGGDWKDKLDEFYPKWWRDVPWITPTLRRGSCASTTPCSGPVGSGRMAGRPLASMLR